MKYSRAKYSEIQLLLHAKDPPYSLSLILLCDIHSWPRRWYCLHDPTPFVAGLATATDGGRGITKCAEAGGIASTTFCSPPHVNVVSKRFLESPSFFEKVPNAFFSPKSECTLEGRNVYYAVIMLWIWHVNCEHKNIRSQYVALYAIASSSN